MKNRLSISGTGKDCSQCFLAKWGQLYFKQSKHHRNNALRSFFPIPWSIGQTGCVAPSLFRNSLGARIQHQLVRDFLVQAHSGARPRAYWGHAPDWDSSPNRTLQTATEPDWPSNQDQVCGGHWQQRFPVFCLPEFVGWVVPKIRLHQSARYLDPSNHDEIHFRKTGLQRDRHRSERQPYARLHAVVSGR